MLTTTRDMIMPTAITGSYPRPLWFDASLQGRSFKAALGDSLFREQYLDAVAAMINAQEAAGLDIVTDGDSRFDLDGRRQVVVLLSDRAARRRSAATARPRGAGWAGTASSPAISCGRCRRPISRRSSSEKLSRGPLEYAALWQIAQRLTRPPGQVRHDLRAGLGQHAVEPALPRRQGDGARPLRHHERRTARVGRGRLPGDPGRGAAPSRR